MCALKCKSLQKLSVSQTHLEWLLEESESNGLLPFSIARTMTGGVTHKWPEGGHPQGHPIHTSDNQIKWNSDVTASKRGLKIRNGFTWDCLLDYFSDYQSIQHLSTFIKFFITFINSIMRHYPHCITWTGTNPFGYNFDTMHIMQTVHGPWTAHIWNLSRTY